MKKILVIDDVVKVRRIYKDLLKSEGYAVFEASGAVEAKEILKNDNIDLVLLDIKMPEFDGRVMHDILKDFHKNVNVIVCSVFPMDEQKRIISDAADYYDKSRDLDMLIEKVNRVLQN